jgi:hypothetical protein
MACVCHFLVCQNQIFLPSLLVGLRKKVWTVMESPDKQEAVAPKIDCYLCVSASKSFISKPFQKVWVAKHDHDDEFLQAKAGAEESYDSITHMDTTIDTDSFKLQQSVIQHDGVEHRWGDRVPYAFCQSEKFGRGLLSQHSHAGASNTALRSVRRPSKINLPR